MLCYVLFKSIFRNSKILLIFNRIFATFFSKLCFRCTLIISENVQFPVPIQNIILFNRVSRAVFEYTNVHNLTGFSRFRRVILNFCLLVQHFVKTYILVPQSTIYTIFVIFQPKTCMYVKVGPFLEYFDTIVCLVEQTACCRKNKNKYFSKIKYFLHFTHNLKHYKLRLVKCPTNFQHNITCYALCFFFF